MTAFLGYVLPYGQMSLWGATVITNLLSAIPWLGKSLVELKIKIKNNIKFLYNILLYNYTKICIQYDWSYNQLNNKKTMDTIGKISPYALKKGRKDILDKNKYYNISYSFLAMLVGFIDGDGYICITKTKTKYIKLCLVISLDIKDISILKYIQSVLSLGIINTYPKKGKKDTCKLVINKTDLQDVLFPLLIYHNIFFLTKTRIVQYNKALYILRNNIKYFSEIPEDIEFIYPIIDNNENLLKLEFFDNWIVGFTIAEGSFFIKSNNDACFQLRQRENSVLFEAFIKKFKTQRKISIDNNKYNQFSVSKKEDIQSVINFFSFSGNHPLLGLKLIAYNKWLEDLLKSQRYNKLYIPK